MFLSANSNRCIISALFVLAAALPARALGTLRIQDDVLPTALVGRDYAYILQGVGGQPGYSFTLIGGSLPPGLTLSGNKLTGIPAGAGNFFPVIQIRDSKESLAVKTLSLRALRIEPSDTWCPIDQAGGAFTCLGVFPDFKNKAMAVAGSDEGGLYFTGDGGTTWKKDKSGASFPVADVAVNQCAGAADFWALTPAAGAGTGKIYHGVIDALPTSELDLPASWSGRRRTLKQAFQRCDGPMLASDDAGGFLFKNTAAGAWMPANNRLPANAAGGATVLDFAYGSAINPGFAAALIDNADKTREIHTSTSPLEGWSLCAVTPALQASGWRTLALMPDGLLILGSDAGNVISLDATKCPSGAFVNGPRLLDDKTPVTPVINGFVAAPCYDSLKRAVFAYTSQGLFFTPDFASQNFNRADHGLQSESISDLGVSDKCGDPRLLLATPDHGLAGGTDTAMCHGNLGGDQPVAVNGLAADPRFTSASGAVCKAGADSIGLYLSTRGLGALRDGANGRQFFAGGETREQNLTGIAGVTREKLPLVYVASESGVYTSDNLGASFGGFAPTDEPLSAISAAPLSDLGAGYGVSANAIFAANAPAAPWAPVALLTQVAGASGLDISPGAPITTKAGDDVMWIADGPGGLVELLYIGGIYQTTLQQGGVIRGLDVRRVAAQQRRAADNFVFAQAALGKRNYAFVRGIYSPVPEMQINFAFAGEGLPADEEASQIVAEPRGFDAGKVWVLFPTHGLYISSNSGASFTPATGQGLPPGYNPLRLTLSLDFDSGKGGTALALLVAGRGIYQSADAGNTFCFGPATVNQAPAATSAIAVSMLPGTQNNEKIMLGTPYGAFYSADGGASFHSRFINGNPVHALLFRPLDDALMLGNDTGIYRSADYGLSWSLVSAAGAITDFAVNDIDGNQLSATRSGGPNLLSSDGGLNWTAQASPADGTAVDFSSGTALARASSRSADIVSGATAGYWMVGSSTGAAWSADGASWTGANGVNPDYSLGTVGGNWGSVMTLGGSPSKVLAGNATYGLYRTMDGGDSWRNVSAAGSGLEATSKNASALLTAPTAFSGTDVLVGMTGSGNGGVYLSGDSGEHWTQVNAGYDPNNLSISSLVKTSCAGCPVQYYSGSYGGGLYTRTITVVAPPFYTTPATWCAGGGCSCGSSTASLQISGGQPFKICGSNFQNGLVVEFDGVPAGGCTQSGGTSITCTASPSHPEGASLVRVRNPDTRAAVLPANAFLFSGGSSRPGNSLHVTKATGNASLTWSCAACTASAPARIYRAQNAAFSLYLEQYNGGIGGNFSNGSAVSSNQSYFWTVE